MPTPITVQGEQKIRTELNELKTNRARISRTIAEAREHGDLSENAEYHAAREQQGFNEARIRKLESILADAQIIDITKIAPNGRVLFGTTVDLMDVQNSTRISYRITGEHEADPKQGTISVNAPIARALVGKSCGATVRIETPNRVNEFKIIEIKHL